MAQSQNRAELSRQEQSRFGLPPGVKFVGPFPFAGMNQEASRLAIDDKEAYWQENLIKLGDGYLRAIPDVGAALYTISQGSAEIICFTTYNIDHVDYFAVFLSDGTAVQVDPSGNITTISNVTTTFYTQQINPAVPSGFFPATVPWGNLYLLISNNNTANDYWAWDGTLLYAAGSVGPQIDITSGGSNYIAPPIYTVFGGHGTGVQLSVTVREGSIDTLRITNPGTGYQPGDIAQVAFFGGGGDNGAVLEAVVASTSVNQVVVTAPGSNYATPPAVVFSTGAATATASVSGGKVTQITVTDGGSGYTDAPTIMLVGGGGSGAQARSTLIPAPLQAVNVIVGGSNYQTTPTLSFLGGMGTGAVATANMAGGGTIGSVTLVNGGVGYESAPAVFVETGQNSAASATLTMMPFGVSGTSIETYDAQVWLQFPYQPTNISTGGVRISSAPGSINNFATSSGGLSETNSDRFLRDHYVAIRQSNGYLYPFGDSSVNVLSNVNVSGSPATKTLNNQNTDPQMSTHWRDTLQDFSRTILFTNPFGVWGLYGGAVTKISAKIDQLFDDGEFPVQDNPSLTGVIQPTAAVSNLYSNRVYLCLFTLKDPFGAPARPIMVGWDEKNWFIVSQSKNIKYIGTQEINSDLIAWGTDGQSLFPLMQTPSTNISKHYASKLYGADKPYMTQLARMLYVQAENFTSTKEAPLFTAKIDTEYATFPAPSPMLAFPPAGQTLPPGAGAAPTMCPLLAAPTGDVYGQEIGFQLTTTAADFGLYNVLIGVEDVGVIFV